jgi:iron(III) transport system substrate-binding protein
MKVPTKSLRSAAVLLAAGAVIAGCGASPTDKGSTSGASASGGSDLQSVYSAVNGLTGTARYNKLLQLAKDAGGSIGFYHSGDMTKEVAAFEQATGLKVNDFQATSERVMERVTQEEQAGRQGSDVVLGGQNDMKNLNDQGGLETLNTPAFSDVGADFKSKYDISPIAIMEMPTYNTDKVSASKLPKSWEGLFQNPPGRLGIEITDQDFYETLIRKYFMQQKGMSEQAAINLVTKGYQGAQQVDGHTLVANLLASGQYAYVPNLYAQYVGKLQKSGAPISYDHLAPGMPPFVVNLTAGLTKGGKNPAGGLLLIEWLMGPDGQKVIADQHYVPTSKEYKGQTLLEQYPNAIVQNFYLTDTPQQAADWKAKFQALLQSIGGKPASQPSS